MADWKNIVASLAPTISTVLGGPLAALGVENLCKALGLSDKTNKAIEAVLSTLTPEQALAIKKADQDFQIQMEALGYANLKDLEALSVDDRKDARAMEVNTHSKVPPILAILITVGFFAVLIGMMLRWFNVNDSQPLMIMLGSLSTSWVSVLSFYFGSSHSSNIKTDMLSKSVNK